MVTRKIGKKEWRGGVEKSGEEWSRRVGRRSVLKRQRGREGERKDGGEECRGVVERRSGEK